MDPTPLSHQETPGNSAIPSPQFAILSYFFPTYSVLLSSVNASLGAAGLSPNVSFAIALIVLFLSWRYVVDAITNFIELNFTSSFTVYADDEVHGILMSWIARQPFSQKTRSFVANTTSYSRNQQWGYDSDQEDDDDDDNDYKDDLYGPQTPTDASVTTDLSAPISLRGKHALQYTPSSGTHWFWYKGMPLRLSRSHGSPSDSTHHRISANQDELCVSCLGRNPYILKQLLAEARLLHLKRDDCKTIINHAIGSVSSSGTDMYWQRCMSRPNRNVSTVILPEKVKAEIIADAADYLEPATRRWYANRGIPYRRGYLLHGPPGTGKSSLSVALAGYFRMKIYIVGLNSQAATEENVTYLFSSLPSRCIVLLEDIDTAGLSTAREILNNDESNNSNGNGNGSNGQLSLSALLNILDGVAAQEGRILIMTTNHLDTLDKALIRPGRVDMIIHFRLADRSMTESIFRAIYTPFDGEHHDDGPRTDEEKEDCIVRVDRLAKEFAARIPEAEFSPAEIQGLLLRHKRSARAAVDAADEWVSQMRLSKKDKAEREKREKERELEKKMKKDKGDKKEEKERKGEKKETEKDKEEKEKKEEDVKEDVKEEVKEEEKKQINSKLEQKASTK